MLSRPECMCYFFIRTSVSLTGCRQLQSGKAVGDDAYSGMVDCFRKIIKNEGFSRLYRGINAPILMEAPKRHENDSAFPSRN